MLSVTEIIQNGSPFDYFDFRAEFRIDNQLRCFDINSLDQIFMGENVSIKQAIEEKTPLQWLLELGESREEHFHRIARLSLSWKSKENECYIGNLWIEPEYRGNGLATFIFNEIIYFADVLVIEMTLHAVPFISPEHKPTSADVLQLTKYYQRFGFKKKPVISGITYDSAMVRLPKKR